MLSSGVICCKQVARPRRCSPRAHTAQMVPAALKPTPTQAVVPTCPPLTGPQQAIGWRRRRQERLRGTRTRQEAEETAWRRQACAGLAGGAGGGGGAGCVSGRSQPRSTASSRPSRRCVRRPVTASRRIHHSTQPLTTDIYRRTPPSRFFCLVAVARFSPLRVSPLAAANPSPRAADAVATAGAAVVRAEAMDTDSGEAGGTQYCDRALAAVRIPRSHFAPSTRAAERPGQNPSFCRGLSGGIRWRRLACDRRLCRCSCRGRRSCGSLGPWARGSDARFPIVRPASTRRGRQADAPGLRERHSSPVEERS